MILLGYRKLLAFIIGGVLVLLVLHAGQSEPVTLRALEMVGAMSVAVIGAQGLTNVVRLSSEAKKATAFSAAQTAVAASDTKAAISAADSRSSVAASESRAAVAQAQQPNPGGAL